MMEADTWNGFLFGDTCTTNRALLIDYPDILPANKHTKLLKKYRSITLH